MKFAYLDFEFNHTAEKYMHLVSSSVIAYDSGVVKYEQSFWHNNFEPSSSDIRAGDYYRMLIDEGYIFVAYAAEAEMRSLISLNAVPIHKLKVIDLYLEYRCLLNHNEKYAYGEQLIDGLILKTTKPPPKWERLKKEDGKESLAHHKPSYGLAAACFKLLNEKIDTDEKTRMRDIIISKNFEEIENNREAIEKYNKSDVKHLRRLFKSIYDKQRKVYTPPEIMIHMLKRGEYALRTALMVTKGYPVNVDKVKAFTANTEHILAEAALACNEAGVHAFQKNKKTGRYSMIERNVRAWIESQKLGKWRMTDTKRVSLSRDAFGDYYGSDSDGFGGALYRYLKTKQSLNGFMPGTSRKGSFFDYLGKDSRVRPYFGIYGSQSSRSQPGAISFIPLKAHWMRNFIEAPKGQALCGLDYASQEFLIAAIVSQDKEMMKAYESGDVYLAFAKSAKLVPLDATKDSHKTIRDAAKALVLGISYDMSARGLAPRLSGILKEKVSEERADSLIQAFYTIYFGYRDWKFEQLCEYENFDHLALPDGWVMWGDNDNPRSVGNFPIQGLGAVVMREAVAIAQDRGLDIIYTLHDALYMEFPSYETEKIELLRDSMQTAFQKIMGQYGNTTPIRIEGEAWSLDYKAKMPEPVKNVLFLEEFVDNKGRSDLERYRKYFSIATNSN